jgi:hypothetical protein
VRSSGLRAELPAPRPGELQLWVEVLDRAGNVVQRLASAEAPERLTVPERPPTRIEPPAAVAAPPPAPPHAEPPPRRRWIWAAVGGGAAVALAATGIGLDVASRREYDRLSGTCAPPSTTGQLRSLHVDEGLATGFYVLGGLTAAAAIAILVLDRLHVLR